MLFVGAGTFAGFTVTFVFEQDLPVIVRGCIAVIDLGAAVVALRALSCGIFVSPKGIVVRRLLATSFLPWNDVASFETRLASMLNGAEYIGVRSRSGDLLVTPALSVAAGRSQPWLSALRADRVRWGGVATMPD
jgi:hypothetical protein